jgi:hypothetical protein
MGRPELQGIFYPPNDNVMVRIDGLATMKVGADSSLLRVLAKAVPGDFSLQDDSERPPGLLDQRGDCGFRHVGHHEERRCDLVRDHECLVCGRFSPSLLRRRKLDNFDLHSHLHTKKGWWQWSAYF